ncbi:hypothetical protein [Streptosporangium longisporum]|uniref:DNA-binding protein n=1 Tax=Streptosporangium longisporum TaxID=46187 RepID=A0ABP6L1S5_9ACTN
MAEPLVINKHELALLLGCKVSWIETKCAQREIPHLLLDGYKFTEKHVAEILVMYERRPKRQRRSDEEPAEQPAGTSAAPPAPRRSRTSRAVPPPTSGGVKLRDRGLPLHRLAANGS